MPRGHRSIVIAIAGLILIGANQPSHNSTRNSAATEGDNSANYEKDISIGIGRVGKALETQNSKTDPYEKERNEREIRDLKAQENSAYWAAAMFWATIIAIVLSIIGIGLVWTTFKETKDQTKLAREDADRAKILAAPAFRFSASLVGDRIDRDGSDEHIIPTLNLHATNRGASAASNARPVKATVKVEDIEFEYIPDTSMVWDRSIDGGGGTCDFKMSHKNGVLPANRIRDETLHGIGARIEFQFKYSDQFGREYDEKIRLSGLTQLGAVDIVKPQLGFSAWMQNIDE